MRTPGTITSTVENYVKAIYAAQQEGGVASTCAVARLLGGISPASVSGMIKRLVTLGLAQNVPYHGTQLTAEGEQLALRVLRRCRLVEHLLVDSLGFEPAAVESLAEQFEHVISDELEEWVSARLGGTIGEAGASCVVR